MWELAGPLGRTLKYTRARAYVCTDIRIRAYKHAYMYTYINVRTRAYVRARRCTDFRTRIYARTRMYEHLCARTHICNCVYIYIHMRVCIYTRTRPAIRNTLVFDARRKASRKPGTPKMILWAWWAQPTLRSGALQRQCFDKGPRKAKSCSMRFDFNAF